MGMATVLVRMGWFSTRYSQNVAPWHTEYLKLKESEKLAKAGRSLWPPAFTFLPWNKAQNSYVTGPPPCTSKKEDILTTRVMEFGAGKPVHTVLHLPLIWLVTSSPFTTPRPTLCSFSILHKFLLSLSKRYKASYSGHFFRSSFPCEGSRARVKIQ